MRSSALSRYRIRGTDSLSLRPFAPLAPIALSRLAYSTAQCSACIRHCHRRLLSPHVLCRRRRLHAPVSCLVSRLVAFPCILFPPPSPSLFFSFSLSLFLLFSHPMARLISSVSSCPSILTCYPESDVAICRTGTRRCTQVCGRR